MMIQDMGRYLQERGIGAVGKYIFLSLLPDSPVECMALYEYQGQPGNQIAGTEVPGLQICVRTKRYPDGLSLIHISEPTRQAEISYAVFCLKKKKKKNKT